MITINGGSPQVFNVAAPQCTTSPPITCTLTVLASVGTDTFVIATYSGANGTANLLDEATMSFTISANGSNTFSVTLGPVVSTTADNGAGSLRATIGGANPGDTITFQPGLAGTITLTGGAITLLQNVSISGPGASTMTVSGGGSSQIFTVNAGAVATISGLTLANGKSDTGGAIINHGTLTVSQMTFSGNTTGPTGSDTYYGGAIDNEGALTVSSSTFTNNTSPQEYGEGGAIYNDSDATLNVASSTFTANEAQYGGAIGSESPHTTVTNSTFASNTAVGPSSSDEPFGGAIYSDDDITIIGSTFTTNVSGGAGAPVNYGGAIVEDDYSSSGLTLSNSQFSSNKAGVPANGDVSGEGGAIYDDSGDMMTLSGNTFGSGNGFGNVASGTSDSFGGAISAANSSISLNAGNAFSYNSITSQNTTSGSAGGAIEIHGTTGDLTITGTNTFGNNSVMAGPSATGGYAHGGAISEETGGVIDLHAASGTSFSKNSVSAPDNLGNAAGGAIHYHGTTVCCGSAKNRRAGQSVHGIRPAHGSAKAIAKRTSRTAQRASNAKRRPLQASSYTIAGVTFTANSAAGGASSMFGVTGGAANIEQNQNALTISNSTFTSNTSSGRFAYGGAVSETVGALTLASDQITNNTASQSGGGVDVVTFGSLTVTNCTISGNQVTNVTAGAQGGGGIVAYRSTLNVSGSTIADNAVIGSVAGAGGGGILAWSNVADSATIVNSTIAGNTSGVDGGGIENLASYSMSLTNVTVFANSANSGNGGNLFNDASVTIQNTIVAGGTASSGADIENNGTQLTNGGNLIGVFAGSGSFGAPPIGATPDLTGANPLLSSAGLANNGGSTQTIADTASSPGKGYIPFIGGVCGGSGPGVDQRGYTRGVYASGGTSYCDIGAYEYFGTPP